MDIGRKWRNITSSHEVEVHLEREKKRSGTEVINCWGHARLLRAVLICCTYDTFRRFSTTFYFMGNLSEKLTYRAWRSDKGVGKMSGA